MMRVIAIEQQKGGVGKSSAAMHLAGALNHRQRRVLLLDWDPQGDLTRMCKLQDEQPKVSLPAVITGQAGIDHPDELVVPHPSGFDLVPNDLHMHTLEQNLYQMRAREGRLAKLVRWLTDQDRWDDLIIDCPPALGLLTDNATVATTVGGPGSGVIAVAAPWPVIFGNLQLLQAQLDAARAELEIDVTVLGMVITNHDKRRGHLAQQAYEALAARPNHLGTILTRAVISEAEASGVPVHDYAPQSDAAQWYDALAGRLDGTFDEAAA